MTALAVALVAVIAGQLGLVAWLVYGRIADTRAMATERVAHTATSGLLERAHYVLEQTQTALADEKKLNAGLEDVLAQYINSNPNADLARTNVLSRLVRSAQRQAEAGRDSASRTAAGEIVSQPEPTTTASTLPTLMRPDD